MSTYAENRYNNNPIFDDYFAMDNISEHVDLTNDITPYSMLIDDFKERTIHSEGHCTMDDINEIRAYLHNKIVKGKNKEQQII